MELRLVVAYSLIGVVAVTALVVGITVQRQRARRRLRMRGIKSGETARVRRQRPA